MDLNSKLYSARNSLHQEQLRKVELVKTDFPEGLKLKFQRDIKELQLAKDKAEAEMRMIKQKSLEKEEASTERTTKQAQDIKNFQEKIQQIEFQLSMKSTRVLEL